MTSRSLIALLLAAGLCQACVGPGSKAGIGAGVASGAAYVPSGTSSGTTTVLTYREQGGLVNRTLLTLLTILGSAPRTESTYSDSISCQGSRCTVTRTTTTRVTDTPEELQAKAERASRILNSMGTAELPLLFELDIAMRSLGGDTSGWMAYWMIQGEPRELGNGIFPVARISGGLGAGSYTFHDRTNTKLYDGGDVIEPMETEIERQGYSYIGMPLRVDLAIGGSGLYSQIQADLNLLSMIDNIFDADEGKKASPVHVGLGFGSTPLRLFGKVIFDRLRSDSVTGMVEVSLGF